MDAETAAKLAAGLGMGLATLGPGLGIGYMTGRTADAIARQPEASGDIRTAMIIGVALAEALALYAFVIAILLAVAS
ncbi:MAG TPA: ATP synthase F0 subunit C [Thermoleophilia bacterium]|nr:ATP synthase F0 subunit C [Thermoleophilia bacterium]HZK49101.1 ATP synthase F0 subunit C [Thermoleophilia bacterium]